MAMCEHCADSSIALCLLVLQLVSSCMQYVAGCLISFHRRVFMVFLLFYSSKDRRRCKTLQDKLVIWGCILDIIQVSSIVGIILKLFFNYYKKDVDY